MKRHNKLLTNLVRIFHFQVIDGNKISRTPRLKGLSTLASCRSSAAWRIDRVQCLDRQVIAACGVRCKALVLAFSSPNRICFDCRRSKSVLKGARTPESIGKKLTAPAISLPGPRHGPRLVRPGDRPCPMWGRPRGDERGAGTAFREHGAARPADLARRPPALAALGLILLGVGLAQWPLRASAARARTAAAGKIQD